MQVSPLESAQSFGLYDFSFSDFKLTDKQTVHAAIRMFFELELPNKFHVPHEASSCNSVHSLVKKKNNIICYKYTSKTRIYCIYKIKILAMPLIRNGHSKGNTPVCI